MLRPLMLRPLMLRPLMLRPLMLRPLMLRKVMDVYELEKRPQNFAFYVHGRGHSVAHESRQLIYGWMATHLKPPAATRTKRVVYPQYQTFK
jgi:hypothetical protein